MPRPVPVHVREVLKTIEHTCQCYQRAEQQARYGAWERMAGPAQPESAKPPVEERLAEQ